MTESVPIPLSNGPVWFRTGFQPGYDALPTENTVYQNTITDVRMAQLVLQTDSPLGAPGRHGALLCDGLDPSLDPSYVYFEVFAVDIPIDAETELSYWFYPLQENGRRISVDLIVRDPVTNEKETLRDSRAMATTTIGTAEAPVETMVGMHPGNPKGIVGVTTRVHCTIGRWLEGRRIETILVAYDRGSRTDADGASFGAYVDDLSITTMPDDVVRVTPSPTPTPCPCRQVQLFCRLKNGCLLDYPSW